MANNILIKDGSSNNATLKTTEVSGIHVPHHNIDNLTDILTALTSILTELQQKTEPSNTQIIEGSVSINGTPTIDTGLLQPLTDAQLRATSVPVSGNFYQDTQPVSLATLPGLAAGSNAIGSITNTSFGATQSGSWSINNVSGTVSLPTGAATEANQTSVQANPGIDASKAIAIQGVTDGKSIPVTGTFWQATQPVSLTTLPAFTTTPTFNIGTISTIATETTLSTLNSKVPSNLTVSSTRLLVDGSGVIQPVSLSVAPAGLAYVSSTLVTRPANTTAYTANDVYGGVFELQNIGASGGFVFIESIDIIFNITAVPSGMSSFTNYLFSATPPSVITDNLAFSVSSNDRATILNPKGIVLSASLAQGGGSVVAEARNLNQLYKLANGSTSLWGYLVTNGAFTPAANSESFTIRVRSFAA